MGDTELRKLVDGIPVPEFDPPHLVAPPPLAKARVAIVTTAGLRSPGEAGWHPNDDMSFRVLPSEARDLELVHWSPNADRTGIVADLNVVYPADRLGELVDEGVIGSVGPHNIAFMGGLADETLATIRYETGPAAARVLLDDDVDIVILTPF